MKNLSLLSSLGEEDKVFLVVDEKYKLGTFNLKENTPILSKRE